VNDPHATLAFLGALVVAWIVFGVVFWAFVKGGTDREWEPGDEPTWKRDGR
jgi:hypothetical protein